MSWQPNLNNYAHCQIANDAVILSAESIQLSWNSWTGNTVLNIIKIYLQACKLNDDEDISIHKCITTFVHD